LSIRRTSIFLSLGLVLLFLSIVVFQVVSVRKDTAAQAKAGEQIAIASLLNRSTIELSLERSVMQVTLNLPGAIQPAFRALLDQQRALSDEGFDDANHLLQDAGSHFERLPAFNSAFVRLRREISSIRAEADRQLQQPRDDRPAKVREELPERMKAAIEELAALPLTLVSPDGVVDQVLPVLQQIQKLAWQVREYGGQERTYLAIATATGEPISGERRAEMAQLHKRADAAMLQLRTLQDFQALDPGVRDQIARLGQVYFEDYAETRQSILDAATSGEAYPLTFDRFFELSTEALGQAVTLSYLAGDAMNGVIEARNTRLNLTLAAFIALAALALTVCAGQAYYSLIRVSGGITALSHSMRQVAANNLEGDVPGRNRPDEIGDMARAVAVFRNNARDANNLGRAIREEREAEAGRQAEIEIMAGRFQAIIDDVSRVLTGKVDDMRGTSKRLTGLAGTTMTDSETARDTSAEARSHVQTVASATEQLMAAIQDIAGQTGQVGTLMTSASDKSRATQSDVTRLSEVAEQIGAVVGLISEIAEQTNLLALNATIEAARAGEAGKGFAVVASEVKELATQTARATSEIGAQIEEIQSATTDTVRAIGDVVGAISEIQDLTMSISGAVEQQRGATSEISQSVVVAANGTGSAVNRIASVAHSIEGTSREATVVEDLADNLQTSAKTLVDEVGKFLTDLQADLDARRQALAARKAEIVVITAEGRRLRTRLIGDPEDWDGIAEPVEGLAPGQAVVIETATGQRLSALVKPGHGTETVFDLGRQLDRPAVA